MLKRFLKGIYSNLPLKREIYSVLRAVYRPPEPIYRHLHFKGPFTVEVDPTHRFTMHANGYSQENEVFWGGLDNGWERKSIKLWKELCRTADVIIDVGANTGLYTLVARSLRPKSTIYAFEPLPRALEYLRDNLSINSFSVNVVPKALSDFSGVATVYLEMDNDFSNSVAVNKSLLDEEVPQRPLQIETMTLQELIETNRLTKIDLIKIDVEAHEVEVLRGMGRYLGEFRPDLIIEVLNDGIGAELTRLLKNLGYVFYNIDEAKDSLRRTEEIVKSDYWNYLACTPATARRLGLI